MFDARTYLIRRAVPTDQDVLKRLARLDTQRPIAGDVLIGEIGGIPAAAIALTDGRVIADPFMATAGLVPLLRARYRAFRQRPERSWLIDLLRPRTVYA